MRNKTVLLIVFLIAVAPLNYEVVAQNLLLTDYEVPVTSASSLLVDLNYNYATLGDEETANQGKIGAVYKTFYESLIYGRSFDLVWSASRNMDANDFSTDMDWRVKKFVHPDSKGFGSISLNGEYFKRDERPSFDVTVGVGWGRFINATALAKAVRIEDFLLFSGRLHDDLPAETMIELAQIIERQSEYRDRYGETYKRVWFDDMTEVIKASKMLVEEEVDAERILRMDEALFRERIADRFYGWDVTLGAKLELLTSDPSIERANPAADVSARYSRPISWRSQFNERFTINSPIGRDFFDAYNVTSATDFSYEVTNRIDVVLSYLIRSERRAQGAEAFTSQLLSFLFVFFLENQVNLTTSVQFSKSSGTRLSQNYVMALNYRVF
jgi:hypothetical protein